MKTLFFVILFSLSSFSLFAKELVIISDLDETLRMADVEKKGMAFLKIVGGVKPYPALVKIFQHLKEQNPDAKFYYLSNSYTIVYNGKRWINKHHLPQGEVFQRRIFKDSSDTFKPKKLKEIVARHPDARILMFGDNIERDPLFYHDLVTDTKLTDYEIFIRDARLIFPEIPGQVVFQHETQIAEHLASSEVKDEIKKLGLLKMIPKFLFKNLKSRIYKECEELRSICREQARQETETIRQALQIEMEEAF